MVMYRCSIREMLTEKLQNCNGFFTTHLYPAFVAIVYGRYPVKVFKTLNDRQSYILSKFHKIEKSHIS